MPFTCKIRLMSVMFVLVLASQITAFGHNTDTLTFRQPPNFNPKLLVATSANVAAFAGTLVLLDHMWYRQFPRSAFRFHDDLKDWKQMDKLGHAFGSYMASELSYYSFRWANLDPNKSALIGSIAGTAIVSTIEILDGFSPQWGFSWSDMGANIIGSASFLAQHFVWQEQKIRLKYSYTSTGIERFRPDLLGSSLVEKLVKDYNGHTFWVSANLSSIFGLNERFPGWLNLAVGHGASGMLGSRYNPSSINGLNLPSLARYRQWYLAPDIDLSRIDTGSQLINSILTALNFIKLPTPVLEFNSQNNWVWHWLYF